MRTGQPAPTPSVLHALVLLVLYAAVLAPSGASAQVPTTIITGEATCGECEIELRPLATIHDTTYEGGALMAVVPIHVNLDRTFLALSGPFTRMELFFADETGAIRRRLGGPGEGPGDYRFPLAIAELPSGFAIFDTGLLRVTLLAKGSLDVEETRSAPGAAIQYMTSPPLFFSDGSYVVGSDVATRDRAGHSLHTITKDGELNRSFGDRKATRLALSGDTAFWASRHEAYRFEKWSKEGALHSVVERRAEWFPPEPDSASRREGDRLAMMRGMREDGEGRLWVLVHIGTWKMVERRGQDGKPHKRWALDRDPRATDTVIEVLDPKSGEVIATKRFPGTELWHTLDGGIHYKAQRTMESGLILFDVWSLRLAGG